MADRQGRLTYELLDGCAAIVRGGVSCFIAGFTSVSDLDPGFSGMARLSNETHLPGFRRLADICHAEGCAAIVQLALSECCIAKDGRIHRNMEPNELDINDLKTVEDLFTSAAAAGLDGVQILQPTASF